MELRKRFLAISRELLDKVLRPAQVVVLLARVIHIKQSLQILQLRVDGAFRANGVHSSVAPTPQTNTTVDRQLASL